MWNQSINIDILADELISELSMSGDISAAAHLVKKEFPSFSDSDAVKICQLITSITSKQNTESVEIVTTTPVSFLTKTRKTHPVIHELISEASQSILLTGYSISDHLEEMFKLINAKSKRGVVVELFVNKYESVKSVLMDVEHINRHFFKVYEYSGKPDDRMASLHAKTIVVDEQSTLISSANLSYHGLEANIEIGVLITSKHKAIQVKKVFEDLKRQKIFTLVR